MRIRNTLILFGVFLAALLTFAAFQWLGVQTGEEKKHADRFVFPSLNPLVASRAPGEVTNPLEPEPHGAKVAKAEDFRRIVIERHRHGKPQRIEFIRGGDSGSKWQMIYPIKARTDDFAVNNLVNELITLEKQKVRDLGRDLSKLGLDNPDTVVTLTRQDEDFVLRLGDQGPTKKDPVIYATSSESNGKPMLLTRAKVDKVFEPVAAFRDKSLISTSFGATELRLAGTARKPMDLAKDKDWAFKEPAIGAADNAATDELVRQLASVRVERNEDFVADGPLDAAALERYGLAEGKAPYVYAVTVGSAAAGTKPKVETVLVGKADDTDTRHAAQAAAAAFSMQAESNLLAAAAAYLAREKTPPPPTHYYARRDGDEAVVRIAAFILPQLKKTADDLRAKGLTKVDNSKVDAINLVSGGETLRIRRPDLQGAAAWELYSDNRAKVKAQPQAVQSLLDALSKIEIRDAKAFLDDDGKLRAWFGTDPIDLGLDRPTAEITVWQEGLTRNKEGKVEGKDEPILKDAGKVKSAVKLVIGRKDEKRHVVYVRREVEGQKPVTLAVPNPFVFGEVPLGAAQAFAKPPDGRQTFSLTTLTAGGYLAFRDRSLPSYQSHQVTGLRIERPGGTYVLEESESRDEKGNLHSAWKLKQPVEGTPAQGILDLVLADLSATSAEKLITDRPTEKELDEVFGLGKSALIRATVMTRGEKPAAGAGVTEPSKPQPGATYTYVIGKKVPDNSKYPGCFYARMETKPGEGPAPNSNSFVFAVPLSFVQTLDLELRNTTVYPYETTKPTGLTLTWHGETADKKPLTTKLELALAGDKWAVRSLTENGTDAKAKLVRLDERNVNALLRYGPQVASGPSLNPFVVDRFLQHAGAIDPKFRLDPTHAAAPPRLVLEAKYSDGKTRTVILGETVTPDASKYPALVGSFVYAASPAAPGAVMLVNEATWKPLLGGYVYFQEAAKQAQ